MKIVGLCFSTSAPLVALVSKKGGRLAANTVSKWQKIPAQRQVVEQEEKCKKDLQIRKYQHVHNIDRCIWKHWDL